MAANELDQAARLADRHPPELHQRDAFGRDVQSIEYHPAYRELEQAAYGRFGLHAMSHRPGVLGWPAVFPATAKHAFTYLFNQAEFGLGCPINVTDSGAHGLRLFGTDELKARYLERMTTTDVDRLWQGGQYMTEKEGGSDVGSLTTVAVPEGDHWRLHGEKWFCSNADAEVIMLLARPEGAGPDTRGLGLFLMPRHLPDGRRNHYRFVRLKDKLGSRSMASAEVKLEGAVAWQLGELERGFVQMAEMVNWSRLSNGVKSSALMRRAAHDAMAVMGGRVVFGVPLTEKPLARRQMLKILLPLRQSLSLWLFTADALDRAEGANGAAPSQAAAAVLRLATPVLKFRATRDARGVTGESLDMRGGCGYIEDWVNPRLVRDAMLGVLWEGTSNINALDVTTRAIPKELGHEALGEMLGEALDDADGVPGQFRGELTALVERAVAFAGEVAGTAEHEDLSRQAANALYHGASAVLLTREGARMAADTGDARRMLLARLVVDHRMRPRDPLSLGETAFDRRAAELLLDDAPASTEEVAAALAL